MDLPSTGSATLALCSVTLLLVTLILAMPHWVLELAFCSVTLNNTKWQCYIVTGGVTWAKLALARSHT